MKNKRKKIDKFWKVIDLINYNSYSDFHTAQEKSSEILKNQNILSISICEKLYNEINSIVVEEIIKRLYEGKLNHKYNFSNDSMFMDLPDTIIGNGEDFTLNFLNGLNVDNIEINEGLSYIFIKEKENE